MINADIKEPLFAYLAKTINNEFYFLPGILGVAPIEANKIVIINNCDSLLRC